MRRSLLVVVSLVVAPLALAGCKKEASAPAPAAFAGGASAAPSGAPGGEAGVPGGEAGPGGGSSPLSLSVTPATGKKGVPVSAEIGFKVSGGKVTTVALKDDKGKAVAGGLREDGSAWVPAKPLKNSKKYVATVTAVDEGGQAKTSTTSFTTMGQPGRRTGTGLYLFDDHTYGVAMPVVVEFSPGIKKKDRAAVQKRMFVKSAPAQPGTWSWTSSGTQAFYRPRSSGSPAPSSPSGSRSAGCRPAAGGTATGTGPRPRRSGAASS
ncbi:hypothetical protein Asp14428_32420 [Actinoplanes sp. NBRC 14428]|nr:hypothetical protein Asp14428_32420 [Actinoplanes sp. NBRC 14428]